MIENLVLNFEFNNNIPVLESTALCYINYGTIRNVQLNITDSTKQANSLSHLLCYYNNGTIEKFVVNFKESIYIDGNGVCPVLMTSNRGTLKNGYVCGKNPKLIAGTNNSTGVLAIYNELNAIIENVFVLVNVDVLGSSAQNNKIGNLVHLNQHSSVIQNVYSVGIGENMNLDYGPNVYNKNSPNIYNNYYFADEIFTSELETKGNMLSLWDVTFQNQILNSDEAFKVDGLVNEGYYPQLNMPDCMPAQEFVELPEVVDSDLPDILSTKILEQGTNTVKVEFSVNNPSSETISSIQIENLDVEILSQEYNNGKSIVKVELKNPLICVSNYNVLSMSTKGAFGSSYTRPYEEGERVIKVDFYKEIWNVNDWKKVGESPTENYMLMENLDFVNEGNTISLGTLNGIINGNGHRISNVILTNNIPLIRVLNGTLKNLFIDNFSQETTSLGGLVDVLQAGAVIDNVHLTNVYINKTGNGYLGGLLRSVSLGIIKNCSLNNANLISKQSEVTEKYVGGLIGYSYGTRVFNCYVNDVNIQSSQAVNNGIGGVVGYAAGISSINNSYAVGKIISDSDSVGGVIGSDTNTHLENCFSKINISTTNNNVGGITGKSAGADVSIIKNNLSIGNIYTTSGLDALNRIAGNNDATSSNNYAYRRQLLNGYERADEKGGILLNKEEILNLNLGTEYNYNKKNEGILPKLYNSEGTKLLPNQKDIYLNDSETTGINLEVESIKATKLNTTEAEITVRIKNPEEVEITGLEIEDLTATETVRNITQNGTTSITVRATPTRYYDNYKLTGVRFRAGALKENNAENNQEINVNQEDQIKEVEVEIPVRFYKEIYTYEDWQSIEEGTYQNYRLMADIDFRGKQNIKNNITVNRLEAENDIYTLKNIDLSYNMANSGFINNVKESIKNIGFENVTIKNTASGNYCGVIATNSGKVENLRFKQIIIDASNLSFVGAIGYFRNGSVKNVTLDTVNIKGINCLGGLSGRCDFELVNLEANNVIIRGLGNHCGAIVGYASSAFYPKFTNISVMRSEIIGGSYIGGVIGYSTAVIVTNCSVINTKVNGVSYVGGMAGWKQLSSAYICENNLIDGCEISGSGERIGGLAGYSQCYDNNVLIKNSTIMGTSVNSDYVGGMAGEAIFMLRFDVVIGCEVKSLGNCVGGIVGYNYNNSQHAPQLCYVSDTIVEGRSNVGGAIGQARDGNFYGCLINAKITATSHTAGGLIGYFENSTMTTAVNYLRMNNNGVVNSKITAPTKVGGLIGNIEKDLITENGFFFNNYIHAYLNSEDSSYVSMGIGGAKSNNETITNTYVYKYSQINGKYMENSSDTYILEQYVNGDDLIKETTYRNKFGWGSNFIYASLQNNKYPIPSGITGQTGVNLPTDPDITVLNNIEIISENGLDVNASKNDLKSENGVAVSLIQTLPTAIVYPISSNKINVDLSGVVNEYNAELNTKIGNEQQEESPEYQNSLTKFKYYINGQEKETVELSNHINQTYTFKYNFMDTIELKLSNRKDEKSITITPNDVRSEASLVGGNNAYLLGTNLYINGELQQGEYVNIYEGYALRSDGTIINIATGEIVESGEMDLSNNANTSQTYLKQDKETYLEQTPKPLHTYDYKGNTIEVYGTYSKINGNIKLQIYNVRSGKLSVLSNDLDMKIGNNITDNYNDKEYQTILNTSGELEDLKEMLKYPENFLTRNIKQIVQNTDEEKTEIMVLYNTGKVIVFNYVSGEVVYENKEKADEGLTDYIAGSIENIWNDYEEKRQEYAKSKELEQKLAELPVEKAIERVNGNAQNNNNQSENENNLSSNGPTSNVANNSNNGNTTSSSDKNNTESSTNSSSTNSNNDYITVYNAETGKYEVYSEDEIIKGNEETPVSETEKITQNGLESVYGYNVKEETKSQTNGAIIVIAIITVAIIALVVLRRVVVKNNEKNRKSHIK